MGINVKVKKFKKQDYFKLKKRNVAAKTQFEDPEFPANDSSLRLKAGILTNNANIVWKRPTEICSNPRLVVGSLQDSNITQGCLGNCWFVAACCALSKVRKQWDKVVPDVSGQDWSSVDARVGHYGIFRFRLWCFGRWTEITVDDRLPTISGELVFARSNVSNEFWCPLLEKAYAKIFGSYAALESGNLVDALIDFTAGFAERLDLVAENVRSREVERIQLFTHLKEALKKNALMCCAIKAMTPDEMERRTDKGLIRGHAYSITDVRSVNIARTGLFAMFKNSQKLNMVRLRNPWGEKEWNGPFSDSIYLYTTDRLLQLYCSSIEWSKVSAVDRNKIGLTYQDDGEFWMTFEDFCNHFTDLSICNLVNTSFFSVRKTYNEYSFFGRWSDGPKLSKTDRSGGCSNHLETFLRNPQYYFEVKNENEKVLFMLQQEDVRGTGSTKGNKLLSIGFEILKVEVNRKYRVHNMKKITTKSDYGETRNIFHECRLERGVYVLLPTTFLPHANGNYILRVFSGSNIRMREMKYDVPRQMKFLCISKSYSLAVAIKVKEGRGIKIHGSSDVCNPYVILMCGKNKIRSSVAKNTATPIWNTEAVFYLTDKQTTAKFQVWDNGLLKDRLIGEADLKLEERKPPSTLTFIVPLKPAAVSAQETTSPVGGCGQIIVEVLSSSNLASV